MAEGNTPPQCAISTYEISGRRRIDGKIYFKNYSM